MTPNLDGLSPLYFRKINLAAQNYLKSRILKLKIGNSMFKFKAQT